jgi:AraC-like DNA-binding protein
MRHPIRDSRQIIRTRLYNERIRYAGWVDVLSDAITAMRIGQPHSARTERHGPWAVRHPSFSGAGFHVVLQGTCRLIAAEGSPIVLGAGDAVLLPHGSAHGLADAFSELPANPPVAVLPELDDQIPLRGSSGSVTMLCGAYLLDQARPHPLMSELPDVIHLPARVGRHLSLPAAIDLLAMEIERPRPGAGAALPALLDALLVYMLRTWFEDQPDGHRAAGWAAVLHDPAMMAALAAIHGDLARRWTVAELGAQTGLSRAAFARKFTALVGQPPLGYLTWWRMTRAAGLLRDSNAPLGSVATRIGYTSEFAFANAFKREYGIAPGKYRKQTSGLPVQEDRWRSTARSE